MAENTLDTLKQNLIEYVRLQLGDQIIDIELDAEHFEAAYQRTIGTYRQRAQNAYEESYSFMQLVQDVNIYELPQEVGQVLRPSALNLLQSVLLDIFINTIQHLTLL